MSAAYDAIGTAGPSGSSVFLDAAAWVQHLLTGPLATMIAVVAIAGVGFAMLSGRVSVRRGAAIVLGCFLLFGAANVARGLESGTAAIPAAGPDRVEVSPDLQVQLLLEGTAASAADPYAGAAFQR